ncbi:MAG: class II aldolase/adducin family protein [Bacteroidetes bacterium]|nr:class II aldolase/adducin family protein [Bacteroidota bacterium]
MKQNINTLKKQIIEIGKLAYSKGYAAANDGNISARLNKRNILVTPTCVSKGRMKAGDLVILDMNGKLIGGTKKPTSELLMHLQIYKERSDVNSICHLHPPYATGFAASGIPLNQNVLVEAEVLLGKIPLIEYALPGTEELSRKLIPYLKESDAFLLANHGAITVGKNVYGAFYNMETLEHTAHIIFIARQLGHLNMLDKDRAKELADLREKFKKGKG